MKYAYPIVCIFILAFCDESGRQAVGSKISSDSLKKFSYRVTGYTSVTYAAIDGTGCFFKKDGRLYLITAKHVLSGCMMQGKKIWKDDDYPDVMFISGSDHTSLTLDIKVIKDTSSCLPLLKSPDIIAVEVQNKFQMKIYSIENFVSSSIISDGDIEIFGFPSDSNIKNNRANFSASAGNLHWSAKDYDLGPSHLANNIVLNKNENIPMDRPLKGYSGSPVFFKQKNSDQWGIVGIISGVMTDSIRNQNYFIIPKIDLAISKKNN